MPAVTERRKREKQRPALGFKRPKMTSPGHEHLHERGHADGRASRREKQRRAAKRLMATTRQTDSLLLTPDDTVADWNHLLVLSFSPRSKQQLDQHLEQKLFIYMSSPTLLKEPSSLHVLSNFA
jgi:hypothetical protein